MSETILFIDDDIRVVSALQRSLYKNYRIEIAGGAPDALDAIAESSYAVVVSDLKMPGMSGIEFLTKVRQLSPDTIRILLTGQADLDAAIAAVNEGAIFRFLTKPCPQEVLTRTLDAALEQYRLVTAEHEVLRETLMGTVTVLIEILSAIQPVAFGRASRIRRCVRKLAKELNIADPWQFEAAAMLSQIGCISVSPDILKKHYAGEELSDDERAQMLAHAQVGRKLLHHITRLHAVAQMIERQHEDYIDGSGLSAEAFSIALGSQMLRVALDHDRWLGTGLSPEEAVMEMRRHEAQYNPAVLVALERVIQDSPPPAPIESGDDSGAVPVEQQIFRPITEQVLRALRD